MFTTSRARRRRVRAVIRRARRNHRQVAAAQVAHLPASMPLPPVDGPYPFEFLLDTPSHRVKVTR